MSLALELFERHHVAVFRFLRRMTPDRDTAEDLLQEVFLRVTAAATRFEHRGQDRAWLFKIARNLVFDERARRGRRPELALEAPASIATRPTATWVGLNLAAALERLDPTMREAFLLREVGGLGYHEIASVCGTTPDAVRSRIYRARCELRRRLTPSIAGRAKSVRSGARR